MVFVSLDKQTKADRKISWMPRIQKLPVCHTPWLNFQYFDAIFHNTVKHYTASCTHTIVLEYDWWLSCKRQGCLGTWACFASIWQFRELVVTVVQETRTSRVMGMLYSSLVWMHKEQELCFDCFSCLWTHTAAVPVISVSKKKPRYSWILVPARVINWLS